MKLIIGSSYFTGRKYNNNKKKFKLCSNLRNANQYLLLERKNE